MKESDFKITQAQADQAAEYLTGLNYKWATLEWSCWQLCDFFFEKFGRTITTSQARSILYYFRDFRVLTLMPVPKTYCGFQWMTVAQAAA